MFVIYWGRFDRTDGGIEGERRVSMCKQLFGQGKYNKIQLIIIHPSTHLEIDFLTSDSSSEKEFEQFR